MVEAPADGQAVAGLEAGDLVLPVRSGWPGEMDAEARCFWYTVCDCGVAPLSSFPVRGT